MSLLPCSRALTRLLALLDENWQGCSLEGAVEFGVPGLCPEELQGLFSPARPGCLSGKQGQVASLLHCAVTALSPSAPRTLGLENSWVW